MHLIGWLIFIVILLVSIISGSFMLLKPDIMVTSSIEKAVLSSSIGGNILGYLLVLLPIVFIFFKMSEEESNKK